MTETGLDERLHALATDGGKRAPRIAIVAPSGYAPRPELVERGIAALHAQGCVVRNFSDPDRKFQRFGATDDERIAQLYAAANAPDIDIVLALRGGYGLSRLLPSLDFAQLAASGKLFVGHSDFTVLQMGLLQQGGISFAGPMLCDDFVRDEPSMFTLADFWQCLTQPTHTVAGEGEGNPDCDVEGQLWGGNLAMLTHLAGSPWLPQIDGGILFVEDISEHPYRVERMMLQLLHVGVLQKQRAILFGDFSGYRLSDYDNGYDFAQMVDYLRARLQTPLLTGLPFGHVRDKATFAVGAQAHLRASGGRFTLQMRGYSYLR